MALILKYREKLWLAGALSVKGHMRVSMVASKWRVKFTLTSPLHPEVLDMVARLVGVDVRRSQQHAYDRVIVSGGLLEELFDQLWPFLAESRKLDYILKLRECKARNLQRMIEADRRKSAAEALRYLTPAILRQRAEAAYHNQDEAVQLVDEYLDPQFVPPHQIQAMLDAVSAQKAKIEAQLADPMGNHTTNNRKKK